MSTLAFLSLLWVAGFIAWVTDEIWPWTDTAAAVPAAVVAGLTGGIFLAAWTS